MNPRSIGSLLLLALCGCGGSSSDSSDGVVAIVPRWINLQRIPTSSHLRSVRFSADGINGIVAGDSTSIFRTSDGGLTWFQEEHQPFTSGGNIAAFDYLPGDFVLVGSDPAGAGRFWSSTNSVNWTATDSPGAPASPFISADVVAGPTNQPNIAWMLRANGMVRVRQASSIGEADTDFDTYGPAQTVRALDATTDGLAGVVGTGGKFKQITLGSPTWDDEPTGTAVNLNAIQYIDPSTYFLAGDAGTLVFRAPNHPIEVLASGSPDDIYAVHFPVDPKYGWAVGENGRIVRIRGTYDDMTGLWSFQYDLQTPGTGQHLRDVWFIPNAVDPGTTLPLVGYAVGDNGTVLKTTNGGVNWASPFGSAGVNEILRAVDFVPAGNQGLAVGDNGTVLRTLDGFTWAPFTAGIVGTPDLRSVSIKRMGLRDAAIICGDGGYVRRNLDVWGGGTWEAATTPPPIVDYHAVVWWAESGVMLVGNGQTILKSTTPSVVDPDLWTWFGQTYAGPNTDFRTLQITTDQVAYAGGTNGILAGADFLSMLPNNWGVIADIGGQTIRSLDAVTKNVVYFVSDDDVFRFVSLPFSVTPAVQTGGAIPDVVETNGVAVFNTGFLIAVGNRIWVSLNGGTTWTESPDHTTDMMYAVWRRSPNGETGYAVGAQGTILLTSTGGD